MEAAVQRRRKRFNFRGSLCIPYGLFMVLFVILPLLLVLYYAFTDGEGNFALSNWGTVFSSSTNWQIIGMTFVVAFFTTLLCILIGFPIAYLLSNKKFNKNKILVYIFLLPMWINFVLRIVAVKDLVNGLSEAMFGYDITAKYPYISIIIGMTYDYLPFAILPLYNQMLKMDKNQIEAAADLGANPFQVFTKTIIPMTVPGIVSACMMTFMPTMSSYVIANAMSGNMRKIIGNIIQSYYIERTDAAAMHIGSTLSLVMLVIIGLTLLLEKVISGKKSAGGKENLW